MSFLKKLGLEFLFEEEIYFEKSGLRFLSQGIAMQKGWLERHKAQVQFPVTLIFTFSLSSLIKKS